VKVEVFGYLSSLELGYVCSVPLRARRSESAYSRSVQPSVHTVSLNHGQLFLIPVHGKERDENAEHLDRPVTKQATNPVVDQASAQWLDQKAKTHSVCGNRGARMSMLHHLWLFQVFVPLVLDRVEEVRDAVPAFPSHRSYEKTFFCADHLTGCILVLSIDGMRLSLLSQVILKGDCSHSPSITSSQRPPCISLSHLVQPPSDSYHDWLEVEL
jgi:hypothetical protein